MILNRLLIGATVLSALTSGALAQGAAKPTLIGTFNDWSAWSYTGSLSGSENGKICYIYAEPSEMQPPKLDHGRVSFSITASPGQGIANEANFIAGYPLKEQSMVTVEIDGKSFNMFTQGDAAWLLNKEDEPELLAAMRAGRSMVIKATSSRGNSTTYSYSLSGVTAASDKVKAECE
jgi:hypothetical protein